jgi:hypothetical protein
MTHNWKPGDMALVEAGCHANRVVALRTGVPMGWAYCDGHNGESTRNWSSDDSGIVTPLRPLLVIDPENREQVERLTEAFGAASSPSTGWVDQMQVALRSLLEPEPKEPTLTGALVIDAEGADWHRTRTGRWISDDGLRSRSCGWPGLPRPITVLSEGWQETTDE